MGLSKRDTTGTWAINDWAMYVPDESGVNISEDNIVTSDSGRTEDGYMHITWVRTNVKKVSFTYKKITAQAVEEMRSHMQGKIFTLHYYDNGKKSMQGYCGKNSFTVRSITQHASEGGVYEDFSINVEEI